MYNYLLCDHARRHVSVTADLLEQRQLDILKELDEWLTAIHTYAEQFGCTLNRFQHLSRHRPMCQFSMMRQYLFDWFEKSLSLKRYRQMMLHMYMQRCLFNDRKAD